MKIMSKNLSILWKLGLAIIVIAVFIRLLPVVVITLLILFGVFKCKNYFKKRTSRNRKSTYKKSPNMQNSYRKVIDVKFDEVSK
ncbi:hypothetical protein ACSVC9_04280 [Clostridium sp. LBM24168]